MNPKFSIVIPTFNGSKLIKDCLRSFYNLHPNDGSYEVIVVDDASSKSEQEILWKLKAEYGFNLIIKPDNEGFPRTANVGIKASVGQYVVLVNNDIICTKNILKPIQSRFNADSKIGIIGARLYYPNGKIQHGGCEAVRPFYFTHILDPKRAAESRYDIMVTGAIYALRREMIDIVGVLNNDYFLSADDSEYCLRAWLKGWRTFYDANIEAIHLEGATRGRDLPGEQERRNPEVVRKERLTIGMYLAWAKTLDWNWFVNEVKKAREGVTSDISKLEVGSGPNGISGYLHLDVRPLPGVDVVCDFSKEVLPFGDDRFEEILSNHSIEHISFRKIPFVIKEWFRVLKPGGKVFLRTPDLEFICKTYLAGQTTPEHPNDENFITDAFGEVTPAWWANIKLFAGQDYPSNFHYLCFDFKTIKEVLKRYGFERIERVNVEPVFSPGELQVVAYKPHKVRPKNILLKRRGALGDVLLITPIIRELNRIYGNAALIYTSSDYPQLFREMKEVTRSFNYNEEDPEITFDEYYNLDLTYEREPKQHIVDAYTKVVFGKVLENKTPFFCIPEAEKKSVQELFISKYSRFAICNFSKSWENRTIHSDIINGITSWAKQNDVTLITVGLTKDIVPEGSIDLRNVLTLGQIRHLVDNSLFYIGNDSGLFHLAMSGKAPVIGLFTCVDHEYRALPRSDKDHMINASIDCHGCHVNLPAPMTTEFCKRKDNACTNAFDLINLKSRLSSFVQKS